MIGLKTVSQTDVQSTFLALKGIDISQALSASRGWTPFLVVHLGIVTRVACCPRMRFKRLMNILIACHLDRLGADGADDDACFLAASMWTSMSCVRAMCQAVHSRTAIALERQKVLLPTFRVRTMSTNAHQVGIGVVRHDNRHLRPSTTHKLSRHNGGQHTCTRCEAQM